MSGLLRPVAGNEKLALVPEIHFVVTWDPDVDPTHDRMNDLERRVEEAVLNGKIVVISTDLPPRVFERSGVVPLRWGSPRIIVVGKGWRGSRVKKSVFAGEEPVPCWKLWRYKWDGSTDLLALPALKRSKS